MICRKIPVPVSVALLLLLFCKVQLFKVKLPLDVIKGAVASICESFPPSRVIPSSVSVEVLSKKAPAKPSPRVITPPAPSSAFSVISLETVIVLVAVKSFVTINSG